MCFVANQVASCYLESAMTERPNKLWGTHTRTRLLAGVLLLVPLVVTVIVLRFLLGVVRGLLDPALDILGASGLPDGAALAISLLGLVLVVYLAGLLAANVFGRRIISITERLFSRVPLVKSIYTSSRKAVDMLSSSSRTSFKSVALVEFPGPGMRSIAFVTGTVIDDNGRECYKLFVPTTPNPTSGFLQIIPKERVVITTLSVEDGIKMVVSGGILSPEKLDKAKDDVSPAPGVSS